MRRSGPLLVAAILTVVLSACDWPMYRYGPAHTGYNNTENTINVGNVANLTPLFVAPHTSLSFDSSPAVAKRCGLCRY